jgi:hypothetical protein
MQGRVNPQLCGQPTEGGQALIRAELCVHSALNHHMHPWNHHTHHHSKTSNLAWPTITTTTTTFTNSHSGTKDVSSSWLTPQDAPSWVVFLQVLDLVSTPTEASLRVVGTSYSSRGSQPEGSSRPGRGLEMTICIPWLWLEAVQLWFCSKAHECGLLIRLIITSFWVKYIHTYKCKL